MTTRVTTTIREETREATTSGKLPTAGHPDAGAAGALLGQLFSAHSRMVLGLCRLLLRDPVEAEDAVQQVFLPAQRALVAGVVPRDPLRGSRRSRATSAARASAPACRSRSSSPSCLRTSRTRS